MIVSWIGRAFLDRPRNFAELVTRLPGVDPILVFQALTSDPVQNDPQADALVQDARQHRAIQRIAHPTPIPHPLDFDWRYGTRAIETLTRTIELRVPADGCIGLIGAPTLVKPLLKQSAAYRINLIDRNPLWQREFDGINLLTLDVSTDDCPEALRENMDLVVIDPPWYDQGYATFMWFARRLLKSSGTLAVSVLPLGTRPSAAHDREQLVRLASRMGFELQDQRSSVLSYATPPFEVNALRSAGIHAPLEQWRIGDLWQFSVKSPNTSRRPTQESRHVWLELRFDAVRVQFDTRAATGAARLESIVDGDVLPSVSARFPGRERATIWTSGNRVFACANSAALYDLCRGAAWDRFQGFTSVNLTPEETVLLASIAGIIEIEGSEYGYRQ